MRPSGNSLEAMAREPALRDCTDEGTLRTFLLDELARLDPAAAPPHFAGFYIRSHQPLNVRWDECASP